MNHTFPVWMNYALAGVALLMVYAISEWGWTFLTSPLLFLLGLAAAAFGIVTVIRRRTDHPDGGIVSLLKERTYIGIAALAYGFSAILLGVILLAGAVLRQLGVWARVWAYLQANPGWLLLVVGLLLLLGSVIGLFGPVQEDRGTWQTLAALPRRVLAVIGILAGFSLLVIGLLEILYRPGFDSLVGAF